MNIHELVPTIEFVTQYDKEIGDLLNGELLRQRRMDIRHGSDGAAVNDGKLHAHSSPYSRVKLS